jgi:hypothetical protein
MKEYTAEITLRVKMLSDAPPTNKDWRMFVLYAKLHDCPVDFVSIETLATLKAKGLRRLAKVKRQNQDPIAIQTDWMVNVLERFLK